MSILSESMRTALAEQYRHELRNQLRYVNRASYAEKLGLVGTAAFFNKQAADEAGHAAKVREYIEDRNESLEPAPFTFGIADDVILPRDTTFDPSTFIVLFESGLAVERDTTERLKALYTLAAEEGDLQTVAWLIGPGGLLPEQTEEERTFQTILDRIASRCVEDVTRDLAGVHDLDVWIADQFGG